MRGTEHDPFAGYSSKRRKWAREWDEVTRTIKEGRAAKLSRLYEKGGKSGRNGQN